MQHCIVSQQGAVEFTMPLLVKKTALVFIGTRPEAIKMAPLVRELKLQPSFNVILCSSGQHEDMLNQALSDFDLAADIELNAMRGNRSLSNLVATMLADFQSVIGRVKPDVILVHGDTATTLAGSLAAYFNQIPLAHVEAGLRTYDKHSPWPEEINRRVADLTADLYFAPTSSARQNLLDEGARSSDIIVTGNTVIDALLLTAERLDNSPDLQMHADAILPRLDPAKKLVLVTSHRRENLGAGLENICDAIRNISNRDNVEIVFPVHMNPKVRTTVDAKLSALPNVHLTEPLNYLSFVRVMSRAYLVISDSGGIQEEAPSLGVPVLVTRDTTERPEAAEAGTVRLVGTNTDNIVRNADRLLSNPAAHRTMSEIKNPYGDGTASKIIVKELARRLTALMPA